MSDRRYQTLDGDAYKNHNHFWHICCWKCWLTGAKQTQFVRALWAAAESAPDTDISITSQQLQQVHTFMFPSTSRVSNSWWMQELMHKLFHLLFK
jgi:hypothetical protein